MDMNWAHPGTSVSTSVAASFLASFFASFLASFVECVEALTVVLAVGSVRGWRSALAGCAGALALLALIVLTAGRLLLRVPLHALQLAVGVLLLMFGLRWLRKAVLRAAGLIPLHDEEAAFAKNTSIMRSLATRGGGWDRAALAASFNITMLEGTEVVFIVVAISAGGAGTLLPAGLGAGAALLAVAALGLLLHKPLARVPENLLKFTVGVLLSAFGTFWVGEGMRLAWPGDDLAILWLIAAYLLAAVSMVTVSRRMHATASAR